MDNQKQQVVDRIKEANNILVTVRSSPSIDQLAACIGLTLTLNKLNKHATAVFSGEVPSVLEFLQPEKTIEKNTDSLRDFIIALDKSKADKLRYKVEDAVVKIFITPYRTSISDRDLQFSQGDFNVDVVLAIGVHSQADLDQAITAHGRILHDATVVTINNKPGGELGAINWLDASASSLSELCVQIADAIDNSMVDSQIATAFLTGIVAETERFSNNKTSPQTMSISAELMTAGANQQLVATKLETPEPEPVQAEIVPETPHNEVPQKPKSDDGTLEISHSALESNDEATLPGETPVTEVVEKKEEPTAPQIHIDDTGKIQTSDVADQPDELPAISHHDDAPKMVLEPPTMGGQLSATAMPHASANDDTDLLISNNAGVPVYSGLDVPPVSPGLIPEPITPRGIDSQPSSMAIEGPLQEFNTGLGQSNDPAPVKKATASDGPFMPLASEPAPSLKNSVPDTTLSDLERTVHSPHIQEGASLPDSNAQLQAPLAGLETQSMRAPDPEASPPVRNVTNDGTEPADISAARSAVEEAIQANVQNESLPPAAIPNAQPVDSPPIGSKTVTGSQAAPVLPLGPQSAPSLPPVMAPPLDGFASPALPAIAAVPQVSPTGPVLPEISEPMITPPSAPPPLPTGQ